MSELYRGNRITVQGVMYIGMQPGYLLESWAHLVMEIYQPVGTINSLINVVLNRETTGTRLRLVG